MWIHMVIPTNTTQIRTDIYFQSYLALEIWISQEEYSNFYK